MAFVAIIPNESEAGQVRAGPLETKYDIKKCLNKDDKLHIY